MREAMRFISYSMEGYYKGLKALKESERVSPKEYGEYLQKKEKEGKKKMSEDYRLTFETDVGISIDKYENCPTCSICWNCDRKVRDCVYFNDAVERLAKYESIGSVEELRGLKEKSIPTKPKLIRVANDCEYMTCHHCKLKTVLYDFMRPDFCPNCGGVLDWNK